MDIVDAQVHLNRFGSDWQHTDPALIVDYAVATMDALGVDGIVIDEWAGFDEQRRHLPGMVLPNGAMRGHHPFSERAIALHPDRFAYVARIDPRDPEAEMLVSGVRDSMGAAALRIDLPETRDAEPFQRGGYDHLLAAAERHGVPVFAWFPGRAQLLVPALEKYPSLQLILDHSGISKTDSDHAGQLNKVLSLARYPNLALKWCHAPGYLSSQAYPFRDVIPYLRRAIEAFGEQRIMWASDHTESKAQHSWAQALYYILDSNELTDLEKECILGRSARTILRWPQPSLAG
jgi:L-fuconolactonase